MSSMSESLFTLPTREYSAFIFDCDGTLADSMPLHRRAWVAALRKYGAAFEFGWELFMSRAGKSVELTVTELNAEFGLALDPALVAAAQRAEYDLLALAVKPIDQVVDYARSRARAGCPVSVASGGDAATVARTLRTIGIAELFPVVVTSRRSRTASPRRICFCSPPSAWASRPSSASCSRTACSGSRPLNARAWAPCSSPRAIPMLRVEPGFGGAPRRAAARAAARRRAELPVSATHAGALGALSGMR